jgi:hypothetical protein
MAPPPGGQVKTENSRALDRPSEWHRFQATPPMSSERGRRLISAAVCPSAVGAQREEGLLTGVRVLVGTRKGSFVLTADGARRDWGVSGRSSRVGVYHLAA